MNEKVSIQELIGRNQEFLIDNFGNVNIVIFVLCFTE